MSEPLTRAAILAASPRRASVEIEAWGGVVQIRALSAAALAAWQAVHADEARQKSGESMARLIAASVVEVDGAPMFGEEDIPFLIEQPAAVTRALATAIIRHNGLDAAAQDSVEGN